MEQLRLMDEKIAKKYKPYKGKNEEIKSCSLSSRAAKGSVVGAKKNYSLKEKELFKRFMEI